MLFITLPRSGQAPNMSHLDKPDSGGDVMGAFDTIDGEPVFIVADTTRDDAWVSVPDDEVWTLDEWA